MTIPASGKARVEVVARRLYREFMAEDYDEFPWDDENIPSSETEREARALAALVIEALDEAEVTAVGDATQRGFRAGLDAAVRAIGALR